MGGWVVYWLMLLMAQMIAASSLVIAIRAAAVDEPLRPTNPVMIPEEWNVLNS